MGTLRLVILAILALLASSSQAQVSTIWPPRPVERIPDLVEQSVTAAINGPTSKVTVKQVYRNQLAAPVEARMIISLPSDSTLTDIVLVEDGKEIRAETLPAEEARRIYTDIVRTMRDPALIEYIDQQTYRTQVFPVPANGTAEIRFEYVQVLKNEGGLFTYQYKPLWRQQGARPEKDDYTITVRMEGGVGLVESTTHPISVDRSVGDDSVSVKVGARIAPEDTFTMLVSPKQKGVASYIQTYRATKDGEGNFLLVIDPPLDSMNLKPIPKDVVFVLDTSGSMNGSKIKEAVEALKQALAALNDEDRFGIVTFASDISSYTENLLNNTAAEREKAAAWLDDRRATGGTNLHGGAMMAVHILKSSATPAALQQIVLLTDGMPTNGITDPVRIVADFQKAAGEQTRMFALGVGHDVNSVLLDRLTTESRGMPVYIRPNESVEIPVETMMKSISYPVLRDVKLAVNGVKVEALYPQQIPDVFLGQPVSVVGTFSGGGKATVVLTGLLADEPFEKKMEVAFPTDQARDFPYIRTLWAQRKIAWLIDQIRIHGESEEMKNEIVELAKEHNIVTPYTSFLAAPDSARGRYVSAQSSFFSRAFDDTSLMDERRSSAAPFAASAAPTTVSGREFEVALNQTQARTSLMNVNEIRQTRNESQSLVNGQLFNRIDNRWQQDGIVTSTEQKVVRIQFLSNAWFQLQDRHEEVRPILSLGEEIEFVFNNQLIIVGADGLTDELPADI